MFANPSKKVPSGDFELNVRFLVPSSVIFEALTSTHSAQVGVSFMLLPLSTTHNQLVRLNLRKGVFILFMTVVFWVNSSQLYYIILFIHS